MITAGAEVTLEAVASHYDELDAFYREIWGDHVHHGYWLSGDEPPEVATLQLIDRIAGLARLEPGLDVCDAGCGYGGTCRYLAARHGVNITGVTVSTAQYEYARARPAPPAGRTDYIFRDWLENNLAGASFDRLIALESTEHMASKARFFTEAFRVLKPGGRIAISAWLSCENPTWGHRRFLLEPICKEGRMPNMGRASEYLAMIRDAGFENAAFEDVSERVQATWSIICRRFLRALTRDPRYFRFLVNRHARNRVFALTIGRIWLAYRAGVMRYGLFSASRPLH